MRLLGNLENVTPEKMLQALSKRVLDSSEQENKSDLGVSGMESMISSLSKSLGGNVLDLDVISTSREVREDSQDVGWSGALVHAFEDEDDNVRAAAIESLIKISNREYAELGVRAVDAVIDMLNDDVEFVRRKAILALSELLSAASSHIREGRLSRSLVLTLPMEALETATTLLQDKEPEIRLAVQSLLSNMSFPDPQQFRRTVDSLLR